MEACPPPPQPIEPSPSHWADFLGIPLDALIPVGLLHPRLCLAVLKKSFSPSSNTLSYCPQLNCAQGESPRRRAVGQASLGYSRGSRCGREGQVESSVQVGKESGLGHRLGHWGLETRRALQVLEPKSMLFLPEGTAFPRARLREAEP